MAAMQANPSKLTAVTQLSAPTHKRNFSRSPDRSPSRKAQFAARELDPLLKDLSPDSTLEALQEADAVRGSHAEQNALAASISDATEWERKVGIRAAVAAKKLREWTEEVTAWPWPNSHDRAWGAGFLTPSIEGNDKTNFLGLLPKQTVQQYEDRLDEIWDAMETLGMDELKEYVFSSHLPTSSKAQLTSNYERMRDFTALITATVIQSLPVLANLHILLETWSIRLTVLRSIPNLLASLERVRLALLSVNDILKNEESNRKLDKNELDKGKHLFGAQISKLGKDMDKLLNLLEDQEDSLPMAWIDSLEDTERKYAEWVSQAEHVVLRNEMAKSELSKTGNAVHTVSDNSPSRKLPITEKELSLENAGESVKPAFNNSTPTPTGVKRKPLLDINPPASTGHKRGVSEVSMAESTLSNYSFENAEIIDARATPVMPSPRISVIDHQFPFKKDASWMSNNHATDPSSPPRPSMIQRASTATLEVVPHEQVRSVTLRKSASHDMLSHTNSIRSSNSLLQSNETPSSQESQRPFLDLPTLNHGLPPLASSPSPSLRVDPLSIRGKQLAESITTRRPIVPRRSSKRLSMPLLSAPAQSSAPREEPVKSSNPPTAAPITPPDKMIKAETFDDKLKTILASMPTEIRLTDGSDSGLSGTGSEASSRSNSPTRPLKLSPVKDSKLARQNVGSGIRVYHLKGGRTRESAPIKLHVRSIGENGERIMVRVGGGWADLAVYLREYSLHHASRGLAERKMEMANVSGTKHSQPARERPTYIPDQSFDFGLQNEGSKSSEFQATETNPWRPPPTPILPANHNTPLALSTSPTSNHTNRASTPVASSRPPSRYSTTTTTTPMVTTSVTSNSNYTPLGGAGPVHSSRRATSQNFNRTPSSEAWVEGMVNQARAVSGSQLSHNHQHSPSITVTPSSTASTVSTAPITTTTTIFSAKKRGPATTSKRLSSWTMNPISSMTSNNSSVRPQMTSSPASSHLSRASDTSSETKNSSLTASASKDTARPTTERRKSRMNLGDVAGIKGLFSRNRSDK